MHVGPVAQALKKLSQNHKCQRITIKDISFNNHQIMTFYLSTINKYRFENTWGRMNNNTYTMTQNNSWLFGGKKFGLAASSHVAKSSKPPENHARRHKKQKVQRSRVESKVILQYQNSRRMARSSATLESKMPVASLGCALGCVEGDEAVLLDGLDDGTFATGGNGDSATSESMSISAGAWAGGKYSGVTNCTRLAG